MSHLLDSRRVSAQAWNVNPCVHLAPLQLHIETSQ